MNTAEEASTLHASQEEVRLQRFEARLARLEAYLQLGPMPSASANAPFTEEVNQPSAEAKETALELKIGEYWLARVGLVALIIGTAFFIAYPFTFLPPMLHRALGFLAVGGLFAVSRMWRANYPYLSRILFGGGLVLLYYAVLRLHFFSASPVISNQTVALVGLLGVNVLLFFLAARRKSALLTAVAIFLGYATALFGDQTHFTLTLAVLTAAIAVYFMLQHRFENAGVLALALAYVTHLLWLLGNPIAGHVLGAVAEPQNNLVYLFLYAIIFAVPNLWRKEEEFSEIKKVLLPLLNGIGFLGLATLVGVTFFEKQLAAINFAVAAMFLACAIASWMLHASRFATSFYACFGYLALSLAIFARFDSPQYFIWLGWQSLLVISTAIWFRSQIVVVANTAIYLIIFLAYLKLAPSTAAVNVSYAIVALLSARLLNWKTERLALKTELMRNAYLASAFIIVPYGLYHMVSAPYVSLSWLGAAVFYFLMSLLLHNKKYRWMAMLTLFLTIIYVFFVDMARLEAGFRVLSFLVLGVALLAISLLYTRSRKQAEQGSTAGNV